MSLAAVRPALHDPDFYAGDPFPAYRWLRAEAPVYWHDTPGFWAVTRYEDVIAVSRDPAAFCSSQGTMLADLTRPIMPRQSILYIDPPDHVKYRKLVQPGFSPSRLKQLEPHVRQLARALAADIDTGTAVDFVDGFAARLPLLVIAEMLGVPASDRAQFQRWSDLIIEVTTEQTPENMAASVELLGYFGTVIAERRAQPRDDLISTLVSAEVDGECLEEFDLLMFCMTLLVAGNETTRNLLSHGALALATHPAQHAALAADPGRIPAAVEEMLRWGSPITSFMRTATRDAVLRGQRIGAGERVLMLYAAANRDEAVFGPDAEDFRVARDASRHLAFGFGEHFCLGAGLARMEARIAFEELLARFATMDLAGPVERLRSVLVGGIVRLPLAFAR
jgi:cytochrome P450